MRVNDAITLDYAAHDRPVEIEGELIVSPQITCIVDHAAQADHYRAMPGILVARGVLFQLDSLELPHLAGSMVSFIGQIALKGTITHTGLPPLPKCIPYVYEFTFSVPDFGQWHFVNGATFKNLYLHAPTNPSAKTLAAIKPLFAAQLPVMQLRALLASQTRHLVASHVRGEVLAKLQRCIEQAGCHWDCEECPIAFGGQP